MCLIGQRAESNYESFSLINKITLTICNDNCQNCIKEKEGNSENNMCLGCNTNSFPINEEIDSVNGYNCYNTNDERIENYYLDADNIYQKCM